MVGPSHFKVALDGQPLGALSFDNTSVSTGLHTLTLKSERENIELNAPLEVYQDQWVIWELKRKEGAWGLIHYGVKESGEAKRKRTRRR